MIVALIYAGTLAATSPHPRFECRPIPPVCYASACTGCDYGRKATVQFVKTAKANAVAPTSHEPRKCFVVMRQTVRSTRKR